jgi:hypothetical protein
MEYDDGLNGCRGMARGILISVALTLIIILFIKIAFA